MLTPGKGLNVIIDDVRKLDTLVSDIAQASREQSEGITQVNTAITQVDKVTQSTAATAEECASAAEELNAQAAELRSAVADLLVLVGSAGPSSERISGPGKRERIESTGHQPGKSDLREPPKAPITMANSHGAGADDGALQHAGGQAA